MSRHDVESVLNESIRLALRFLERQREFCAFAVFRSVDGQIAHIEPYGNGEFPVLDCVDGSLTGGPKDDAAAEDCSTTAIVSHARLGDPATGEVRNMIRLEVADQDVGFVTYCLPYAYAAGQINLGRITVSVDDDFPQSSNVVPSLQVECEGLLDGLLHQVTIGQGEEQQPDLALGNPMLM